MNTMNKNQITEKPVSVWQRYLTYFLCGMINIQPVLADVIVDNSLHNTSVNAAGNGVEVINISTPNSQGLSHNQYQQFHVDPQGLILNNSTEQLAQSELAGYLTKNPNLNGQAASVILNEVTGATSSQLQGYTEVFGQEAQVILANPYGITCSGCGFINTPRVTLSTGTPQFEADQLNGFNVSQGSVIIDGLGLDGTRQTYFDIIARTVKLNAAIHANDLTVVTGQNQVSYETNQVTEKTDSPADDQPELAIDSSALGGMYAGRIALIATEDGVGVNAGNLSASAGEIQISADGKVTLGASSANTSLTVTSTDDVNLSGSQFANQQVAISGQSVTATQATIASGNQIQLNSDTSVTLDQSKVIAGIDQSGTVQDQANLTIQAGQLAVNQSQLISHDQLTATAATVATDSDSLISGTTTTLNQLQQLSNQGTLAASGQLNISGTHTTLTGEGQVNATTANITADQLTLDTTFNTGTMTAQGQETLKVTTQGTVSAANSLTLQGQALTQHGTVLSGGSATLTGETTVLGGKTIAGTLMINGGNTTASGQVTATGQLQLNATSLALNGTVQSGNDAQLTVTDQLTVSEDGQLLANDQLNVETGTLSHAGIIAAGGDIGISGEQFVLNGGIQASDDVTLNASKDIVSQSYVAAGQNLTMTADSLTNSGQLSAGQAALIQLNDGLNNTAGGLISGQNTGISAKQIQNSGQLQALTAMGLTAEALNNSGILVASDRLTTLISGHTTNQGLILSDGTLNLLTGSLTNQAKIVASEQLVIAKDGALNLSDSVTNSGVIESKQNSVRMSASEIENNNQISAGKYIRIRGGQLSNEGEISAKSSTLVSLSGALTNSSSGLISGNLTHLNAGSVDNKGQLQAKTALGVSGQTVENSGAMVAQNDVTISAGNKMTNTGQVLSGNSIHLYVDELDNQSAVIANQQLVIAGDLTGHLSSSVVNHGSIESRQGDAEISVAQLTNEAGHHIMAGQNLTIDSETLDNAGELSAAQGKLQLSATQAVINQDEGLISGNSVALTAPSLENRGQLQSLSDMELTLNSFDNTSSLVALRDLILRISGSLTNHSSIASGNQISLLVNTLENSGTVTAGSQLLVAKDESQHRATSLTNTGTMESQQGDVLLAAEQITGQGTDSRITAAQNLTLQADTLNNDGEISSGAQTQLTLDSQLTSSGLISGQAMTIESANIDNQGQLQSLTDMGLTATAINNAGVLVALNHISVQAGESVTNSGHLSAGGDISLLTDQLENQGNIKSTGLLLIAKDAEQSLMTSVANSGAMQSLGGDVIIAATDVANQTADSSVSAAANLTVQATNLTNAGEISSQEETRLTLAEKLTNSGLVSGQNTTITAPEIENEGQLQALADMGLTADALQSSGALIALNNLTVQVANSATISKLYAGQDAFVLTPDLTQKGDFIAGRNLLIAADSDQTPNLYHHESGHLEARTGNLEILTQSSVSLGTGEHMIAGDNLTIHAAALNNSGDISSQGTTELTLDGELKNYASALISGQSTQITSSQTLNYGQMQALTDLTLTTGSLDNRGAMIGQHDLTAQVAGMLTNRGSLLSGHQASLFSAQLNNSGKIVAAQDIVMAKDETGNRNDQIVNSGQIESQSGSVSLATTQAGNTGNLSAGKDLTLAADTLTNRGEISAKGQARLTLDSTLTNASPGLISGGSLTLSASQIHHTGQFQSLADLGLTADSMDGFGGMVAMQNLTMQVRGEAKVGNISAGHNARLFAGRLTHRGNIVTGNDLDIAGYSGGSRTRFSHSGGNIESRNGDVDILASGTVSIGSGERISAGDNLTIRANEVSNRGQIASKGQTKLKLDSRLINASGGVITGRNTEIEARTITNAGYLQALSDMGLTADSLESSGAMVAMKNLTVDAGNTLTTTGQVSAGGTAALLADHVTSRGDVIVGVSLLIAKDQSKAASSSISLEGGHIDASRGSVEIVTSEALTLASGQQLSAGTGLKLEAAGLTNHGEVSSMGETSITLSGDLNNAADGLISGKDTVIEAENITNAGQMQSLNDLGLTGESLVNTGSLVALHDLSAQSTGGELTTTGKVTAGHNALLLADQLTYGGEVTTGNDLVIAKDESGARNSSLIRNSGSIEAGSNLIIATQSDITLGSGDRFAAGNNLVLDAASLTNDGEVSSKGVTQITIDGALTNNTSGLISGQNTSITAGGETVNKGQLQAEKDLSLKTTSLNNQGSIIALGNLLADAGSQIDNQGLIYAGANGYLYANNLTNFSDIMSGQDLVIAGSGGGSSQKLTNSSATISAGGNLTISASVVENIRTELEVSEPEETDLTGDIPGGGGQSYTVIFGGSISSDSEGSTHCRDSERSEHCTSSGGSSAGHIVQVENGPTLESYEGESCRTYGKAGDRNEICHSVTLYKVTGNTEHSFIAFTKSQTLDHASAAGRILSGGDLTIQAGSVMNQVSQIAGKNVSVSASQLTNEGYEFAESTTYYDYKLTKEEGSSYTYSLVNIREENAEEPTMLQSSITASNNLAMNVTNEVNNSVIDGNAGSGSVGGGSQSIRATSGPGAVSQSVQDTHHNTTTGESLQTVSGGSTSAGQVLQTKDISQDRFSISQAAENTTDTEQVRLTRDIAPEEIGTKNTQGPAQDAITLQISQQSTKDLSAITPNQKGTASSSGTEMKLTEIQGVSQPEINLSGSNNVAFPDFRLPTGPNGLFIYGSGPQSNYVIETNSSLTNLGEFVGSDYFAQQVGFRPDLNVKFLGDAYYDTRTVSQAIFEQTGKRYLNQNVGTDLAQMQQLIQGAAEEKTALNLSVGVSLTKEQIASLTHDIVWYEKIEVNGRQVLAPKLYLASASKENISGGALIAAGNNLGIQAGSVTNSGEIEAQQALQIVSTNHIVNQKGGSISGGDVYLNSLEGSVINQTSSQKHDYGNGWIDTSIGKQSTITATDSLAVTAAQDILNHGASMTSGGDALLKAGQNIDFTTIENEIKQTVHSTTASGRDSTEVTHSVTHQGSTVDAAGDLAIVAGNNLHATAATIAAGGTAQLVAGQDLILDTAQNITENRTQAKRELHIHNTLTHQGTKVSGSDVIMSAGHDMTLTAAQIDASGSALLKATGDVTVAAASDSEYRYDQKTKKKSFGRSKTTIRESIQETVKGTQINTGGNLTISAQQNDRMKHPDGGSSINLVGSTIKAQGEVTLQASGDVNLVAQQYRDYSYSQTIKKGFGGLTGSNKGSLSDATLLESTNTIAGSHVNMDSGHNIDVVASNVAAGGDVNLQAMNDVNITAADVLLNTKDWDEKTSLFSGGHFLTMEADRAGQQTTTAQSSQIQSGGDMTVHGGRVAITGSQLFAGQSASVTADTGDVVIQSAENTSQSYKEHEKTTVDLFSSLMNPAGAISFSGGQVGITIAEATYDKTRHDSDVTSQTGSAIVANQGVNLAAVGDLTVAGSQVVADNDQDEDGDLNISAENVVVKESTSHRRDQSDELHGKAEVSLVVQHQAVQTANAVKALQASVKALNKARQDYKQYKSQLVSLKSTLSGLKADLAEKKPGVSEEDIEDLADLIDDLESDKKWYVTSIAMATEDVAAKRVSLAKQASTTYNSAFTYGFNAGLHLDIDVTKTSSDSQQSTSQGSLLSGNNVHIQAGNETGQSATVQGSAIAAKHDLSLSGHEVNLLASTDQSESASQSKSAHIGASMTVYGASGGGINLDASYSRNENSSRSQTHTNSTLNADNIQIVSAGDTNVKGATVRAESELTMNVGGDLNVASVQDHHSSSSKGQSISGGVSLTGAQAEQGSHVMSDTSNAGTLTGVNGGFNVSNGRDRSRETVLTSLTSGGTANITVGGNTDIKGATIATTDADGKDTGELTLKTGTLTYSDLSNTSFNSNMSAGFSTGAAIGDVVNEKTGETETQVSIGSNTTSAQLNDSSDYHKGKTLATVGQGSLIIGDEAGSDDTTALNRDVENSETDLFTVKRQQGDFDVTIDHRFFHEEGRNEIAHDLEKEGEIAEDVASAVSKVVNDERFSVVNNLFEVLGNNKKLTMLNTALETDPAYQDLVSRLQSKDDTVSGNARKELFQIALERFGLTRQDLHFYDSTQTTSTALKDSILGDVKAATVTDENSALQGTSFIDTAGDDEVTRDDVNQSMGQELARQEEIQGQDDFHLFDRSEGEADAVAEAMAAQFAHRLEHVTGADQDYGSGNNYGQALRENTTLVSAGTQVANQVGNATVEYRQLYVQEARVILQNAATYAETHGISETEAKKALFQQALLQVDQTWASQSHIQENPEAREALSAIAAQQDGDVHESAIGQSFWGLLGATSSPYFQAANQAIYEDSGINARENAQIEGGAAGEANPIRQYATANGEAPVDVTLGEAADSAYDQVTGTAKAIYEAVSEDPAGVAEQLAGAVVDKTKEVLADPGVLLPEENKGSAGDRQLAAELQGEEEKAQQEAGSQFIEDAVSLIGSPVAAKGEKLAGELAIKGLAEAAEEVTQAAGKGAVELVESQAGKQLGHGIDVGDIGKLADDAVGDVSRELYRKDGREPSEIFGEGFQPWKPNANVSIENYVNFNEPSQYVGTSKIPVGATEVNTQTGQPGYLYIIDDPGHGIDVNEVYPSNPFSHEQEIAFPGGIDSCSIKGCIPIDGNNNPIGEFIANPNFEE